jgi:anti-sigma B factor antagonist
MLEICFRKVKSVAVLELSGSLDIDSSNLVEKVAWCLESGYRNILCSLDGVNVMDYAGLSALALAFKNTVNHQAGMRLCNVPVHIRKTIELVYLDRVLEIFVDERSALESFEQDQEIAQIQRAKLRRRFKRLPLDIEMGLRPKSEKEFHTVKLLNISAIGMLVFSDKVYPLGEVLDVRLSLKPIIEDLELHAKVVWLVEKNIQPQIYPGLGLEFCNLDPKIQEKILVFVERNLPMDSEV